MSLTEYRRKRNFRVTREPKGGKASAHRGLRYVIQKHAASHLHYDFRLELDGVLLSWAVPKGPSLDPAIKRLAMHVEDHPIEYGTFEGIIPAGQYGGGTVMLWDRGVWEPVEDAKQSYRSGSLKFELKGEKLQGRWMLVRRGGKRSGSDEKHWFLFKERDEFAETGSDVTEDLPLSVATGRDLDEIASAADKLWDSNGKHSASGSKAASGRSARKAPRSAKPMALSTARAAKLAKLLKSAGKKKQPASRAKATVQLATLADKPPDGGAWLHEIKFDGYRMLCHLNDGKVALISRNGNDWTAKFGALPAALAALPITSAIIDGEVVIVDAEGRTSFQSLQNAFQSSTPAPFVFYAFDLQQLNGYDLTEASLDDRKSILQLIIPKKAGPAVNYSEHVVGHGDEFFAEAARLGLEGIVSKRRDRPYSPGRGNDWLKIKCSFQEEFVIGGFTAPTGSRKHFGALLLGYYDESKELIYAGRVGTGFNNRTLAMLRREFEPLIQKTSPFKNLAGRTGQARGVTWLKPNLVGQVQFSNWTEERQLRHPSFQGLREDKPARSVVRDAPASTEAVQSVKKAKPMTPQTRPPRSRAKSKPVARTEDVVVADIRLSHPDKVLYPDDGFTKLDLAHYYERVAEWMLPHVENRLLSLVRCPAGSGNKCFFQKHPGEGTSEALDRYNVTEKEGPEVYVAVRDLSGLVSLVQMGVLEIHQWGSTADKYEKPDRLVIDLDPDPAVEWSQVVAAAKEVKLLLEGLELRSFVKTTGGKGLHVVVPVSRRLDWGGAKEFSKALADFMVAAAPDRYIAKSSKAARKGKIFVDYLRNDRGATSIAPYSTRAKPGATVSVPIRWEELTSRLTSDHFSIRNLPARLSRLKMDPWAEMLTIKQNITAAMLKTLKSI